MLECGVLSIFDVNGLESNEENLVPGKIMQWAYCPEVNKFDRQAQFTHRCILTDGIRI